MARRRIMIVDDDRDMVESLSLAIEGLDCEILAAFSGEEGLEQARAQDFDLILMDVMLPDMNGVESFHAIKKAKPDARVVMMTGFSVHDLLQEAAEIGAAAVMRKPLDMRRLLELVETCAGCDVLVADDDEDFLQGLVALLREGGRTVALARTGDEAVRRAIEERPDVLVIDIRMPGLDGLEALVRLRDAQRSIPTVLVTAWADEEGERLERLGLENVHHVLRKPIDPAELLGAVDALAASR